MKSSSVGPVSRQRIVRAYRNTVHRIPHGTRSSIHPQAFPDIVDAFVTTTATVSSVASMAATVVQPLLQRQGDRSRLTPDDNFQWSLAAVVTFIPLFSWTAWVLPAIQMENRSQAPLYFSYAALYAVPLLRSGFDLDAFAWLMLALGVLHMQVERVVHTEPHLLDALRTRLVAGSSPSQQQQQQLSARPSNLMGGGDATEPGVVVGREPDDDVVPAYRGGLGDGGSSGGSGAADPRTKSPEARELDEFDRRLQQGKHRKERSGQDSR